MIKNILFEDKDIIVVKKPFGIASQADKSGDLDLYTAIKGYVEKYSGCAGLIHRLDRPVSGIMVFSKNKKSAAVLSKQLQNGGFNKEYLAVVCGKMTGDGTLTDWIFKNQRENISKIVCKNSPSAKEAILEYKVIENKEINGAEFSLVKIKLITGRHHQIRVQMAQDAPILRLRILFLTTRLLNRDKDMGLCPKPHKPFEKCSALLTTSKAACGGRIYLSAALLTPNFMQKLLFLL